VHNYLVSDSDRSDDLDAALDGIEEYLHHSDDANHRVHSALQRSHAAVTRSRALKEQLRLRLADREKTARSSHGPIPQPLPPAHQLHEQVAKLCEEGALAAENMAAVAEAFASYLENAAATRGDAERRLSAAKVEREIARIQRDNAAKLRQYDRRPPRLEHLPRLLPHESPSRDSDDVHPDPGD
jgi:conjugal transfer/entry exclusion protein